MGKLLPILIFLVISFVFYQYKDSLLAQYYYKKGDYKTSYEKSSMIYKQNHYDKKAQTIMLRSRVALEAKDFIKISKKYSSNIMVYLKKDTLSKKDIIRMKIIAEYIISRHNDLKITLIDDNEIKIEVSRYYNFFRSVDDKIIKLQR